MSTARSGKQGQRTKGHPKPRDSRQSAAVPAQQPPSFSAVQSVRSGLASPIVWIVLGLIAVNLLVFAPVRHYDFVTLDDPVYVSQNPHVADGLTWRSVSWAFSTFHAGYWIPMVWLSHELDVQLYGMNPGLHHVTNVLLHILNTILLFFLLRRITGAPGRSAFVAALFAIHPLHVESVAWVTERKDMLSTLLLFLTLHAYARYAHQPRGDRRLMVVLFLGIGLMAKPMLVTVPFMLLLLDVWPLRRVSFAAFPPSEPRSSPPRDPRSVWLRLIREKLPLFALAAASSVITFIAQQRSGAVSGFDAAPLSLRVENALVTAVTYLADMIWPRHLAAFYAYPESIPGLRVAGAVVLLVGISVVAVRAAPRRPYLLVGWFWYVGTLLPVSGLVQVGQQARADRFTYVPLIGIFILVAWGIPDLLLGRTYRRRVVPVAAALAILGCTISAREQVRYWENSTVLWNRSLEVQNNYLAHYALGKILRIEGRLSEAVAHFTEALRLKPENPEIHDEMGLALAAQDNISGAIDCFREAVRLKPDFVKGLSDLGIALSKQGKLDEAVALYFDVLRRKPDFAEVHDALGSALTGQGKVAEGIAHLTEALRLKPDLAGAHRHLGLALARNGQTSQSIAHFTEALRLEPNMWEAHNNWGLALAEQGRVGDAIVHYNEALRLKPDSYETHNNLALALAGQGKLGEAIAHLSEAVRLKPDFAAAHKNLGLALSDQGKISDAIAHYAEALRLKPDYAEAYNDLGLALSKQGRLGEAIAQYTEALRLKPDMWMAHINLGLVLADHGRANEAIAQFSEAVRLRPDSDFAHLCLGTTLARIGKVDEAIRQFTAALKINPNNQTARSALDSVNRRGK